MDNLHDFTGGVPLGFGICDRVINASISLFSTDLPSISVLQRRSPAWYFLPSLSLASCSVASERVVIPSALRSVVTMRRTAEYGAFLTGTADCVSHCATAAEVAETIIRSTRANCRMVRQSADRSSSHNRAVRISRLTPRGTSYTSSPIHKDMDRCGPPSPDREPLAAPAAPHRLRPCVPVRVRGACGA